MVVPGLLQGLRTYFNYDWKGEERFSTYTYFNYPVFHVLSKYKLLLVICGSVCKEINKTKSNIVYF